MAPQETLPVEQKPSLPLRRRVFPIGRSRIPAILFVLPAFAVLFAVTIFPLLYELRLTVMSWELTSPFPAHFVGLKNFADILFHDGRFWNALRNTAILIVVGVAIQLVLGTILALLLNRLGRSRTLMISLFLIPVMIAPVVAGFMFRMIYHDQYGPLNWAIQTLSGGRLHGLAWIADPKVALVSILLTDVWQWTPFMVLLVLAGMQSIPQELYEAAEMDGASGTQSFWQITLPLLLPVIVIAVLIRVMDAFKLFDIVFLVTGGGPGDTTETISFYTYLQGFKFFSLGYTAALALIQVAVITVIARMFLAFQKRRRYEAL